MYEDEVTPNKGEGRETGKECGEKRTKKGRVFVCWCWGKDVTARVHNQKDSTKVGREKRGERGAGRSERKSKAKQRETETGLGERRKEKGRESVIASLKYLSRVLMEQVDI